MKESKLLRLLDRYIGTLLCWMLSWFRGVRPYNPSAKKILLIELFEMGASIMIIPTIRHILKERPEAQIYVLTSKGNRNSWDLSGLIDPERIICLDGKNLWSFGASALRAIFAIRAIGVDLAIDFEKFSRISVILSVLAGAKRVAGFFRYEYEGLYRGSTLIDAPCSFNQNAHIALNFLALAKVAFSQQQHYPNFKGSLDPRELELPLYDVTPERAAAMREKLQLSVTDTLVVICPDVGANLQVRNYPVESYAHVARALLDEKPERHIAIIGVESNRPICSQLELMIGGPRVRNLCGTTTSLQELIELFSISELLIGNDNGPLHFASLTATPILGIFSTDSPFMYGPLGESVVLYTFFHCSPCISALNHKSSRCTDGACIKSIPPNTVVSMARKLIAGEIPTRTINGTVPYITCGIPLAQAEQVISIGANSRLRQSNESVTEHAAS
jgi:ADP-heptose:LPS heptosyltransferase